jgi:Gylcosyl hydrolase family 115 C-terminal domain
MIRLTVLFAIATCSLLFPLAAFADDLKLPKVWIYTDMSDPTLQGTNHRGTINDPDDVSAMAGYLLMADRFETLGIVVASTHRKEHATTPDQAAWANRVFGEAYQADLVGMKQSSKTYPNNIQFVQSCIKESAERFLDGNRYESLAQYSTVKSLFDSACRLGDDEIINVLCWGSLTEPAILVAHCLATNNGYPLKKLRFIAHWTSSPLHQGTSEHPERVANCQEDAEACRYMKTLADAGKIVYYECGAIGQHGIVSGSQKGKEYFDQFRISRLGTLFIEGKYVYNSVDHSDSATYWVLLGDYGVSLKDIAADGTHSADIERANEAKFATGSQKIHDELLRRSNNAASKKSTAAVRLPNSHDQTADYSPRLLVDDSVVFAEMNGVIAVEAEHFYKQSMNSVRAWYINSPLHRPNTQPDYDDASFDDAGGLAYMEVLPDLFHTDLDPIIPGHNLGTVGGSVAVLHYKVYFNKPGTYYLWTRLRSNDEEDNTTQAGIDGTWPETAKTLQSPVNKKQWIWKNDNRISRNPWKIGRASLEVSTAGIHDVQFCMREDGEEFDRFILTTDPEFKVEIGVGPAEKLREGKLPPPFSLDQIREPTRRSIVNPDGSIYGANVLYQVTDGKLAIEAEDFYCQTLAQKRAWQLTSQQTTPTIGPDSDPAHLDGASQGAYLELLPDGRQKDEDAIHSKSSIFGEGGSGAILTYMVDFKEPGKYFVWVRALATDGDDNTLHVGLDDTWPTSGKKLTFQGRKWGWSNTQRDTKQPISIDVLQAGKHQLQISMREDGCELDRIFVCREADFVPADDAELTLSISKGVIQTWYQERDARMSTRRTFQEVEGSIAIEVESIPATEGWKYFADGNGHTGFGYLEWGSQGQGIKPGSGLLAYSFDIQQKGKYQIFIRGRMRDPSNRPDTLDPDGNDIWLRLHGGHDIAGQTPLQNGWNKVAILGHPVGWTFNSQLDVNKDHPDSPICRYFDKGTYTIELSGRSEGYAIDRIVLQRFGDAPTVDFLGLDSSLSKLPESLFQFQVVE